MCIISHGRHARKLYIYCVCVYCPTTLAYIHLTALTCLQCILTHVMSVVMLLISGELLKIDCRVTHMYSVCLAAVLYSL